jgi:hypothetical protein
MNPVSEHQLRELSSIMAVLCLRGYSSGGSGNLASSCGWRLSGDPNQLLSGQLDLPR